MPAATATVVPAAPVTIDGREFAVGDLVLVRWRRSRWWAGVIYRIEPGDVFPIKVRCADGKCRSFLLCEVSSHRENFA